MKSNNHCVLASALSQLQNRLTEQLIRITIEQPGYAGFGVTTREIVKRNLTLWKAGAARRMRKGRV